MATALQGKQYTVGPGGQILRTTVGNSTPQVYTPSIPVAQPVSSPSSPVASVASPTVSADPLLQQIQGLIAGNQGTGFDATYDAALRQIQTNLAQLSSGQELSTRRLNEDYQNSQSNLARSQEENKRALSNKLANQGIGISGINVGEQGRLDSIYQNANADLNTQYSRGQEDIGRSTALARQGLSDLLSSATSDKSGRAAEAARAAAEEEARQQAAIDQANANRQFVDNLLSQLTAAVQPVSSPTGQYTAPPALNTPIESFVPSYFEQPPAPAPVTAPIMGGAPQTGAFQLSNLPTYKQRQLQ